MTADTMKFKNPTDHTLNLAAVGLGEVKPGETVDVPLELCAPGRTDAGNRAKSPIECVAPQLVCDDPEMKDLWMKTPPLPAPRSLTVSVAARQNPEPPGVAALRAARAATKAGPVKQSAPQRNTVPATPQTAVPASTGEAKP